MKTFQEVVEDMEQYRSLNDIVLDKAGNLSAGIAIKKHHNCINYGRQIVKSRTSTDIVRNYWQKCWWRQQVWH